MSNGKGDRPHGGVGSAHLPGRGIRSALDVKREMERETREEEEKRRRREEERRDREDRRNQRNLREYDNMNEDDQRKVNDAVDSGWSWRDAIEYVLDLFDGDDAND